MAFDGDHVPWSVRTLPAGVVLTDSAMDSELIACPSLAERLGRAYLDELLGEEASAIRLASAGTRAVVGSGMHPDSALVLRGLGAEPGDFRARQLAESFVAEADLTLTMTRRHGSDVLAVAPRALARTFTLREAAALIGLLDQEVELPGMA